MDLKATDNNDANILKTRVAKGVFWVSASTIGSKLISMAAVLVLARLLAPADFGLVTIATIVMNALYIFNDLGIGPALIHHSGERNRVASTAFFLMPAIGIALFLVAFAGAPIFAKALGNAQATTIIRILSINLFVSSITIVPSMLLEKDMSFKRKFISEFLPVVIYFVVAVSLSTLAHLGAYSIAIGQVIQAIFVAIFTWMLCSWRPSFIYDRSIAHELLGYGKHVLGGSMIAFLSTNMDNIFVTRNAGTTELGYYTLAYSIANLPATHIADIVARVLFPSYVLINKNLQKLRSVYTRSVRVVVFITFPILAGLAALSRPFTLIVLGSKWSPIIYILATLVFFTATRILASVTGNLLMAIGKPKVIVITGVVGLTLQFILLTWFVAVLKLGGLGAAISVSIAGIINWLYIFYFVKPVFGLSYKKSFLLFTKWVLPSVGLFLVLYYIQSILPLSIIFLIGEVVLGVVVYLLLTYATGNRQLLRELLDFVSQIKPAS